MNIFQKRKSILAVLFLTFLLVVMAPYIWLGQSVSLIVPDNMDSNLTWYKLLKDQGKIFAPPNTMVQGLVGETPRFSYPSGWNLELVLVYFFDLFTAYWLNKLLIILVAFVSMFVFIQRKAKPAASLWYIFLFSLVWASLAYYPHRGISIAALPLLFTVFKQLHKKRDLGMSFLTIGVYGFYSMFALVGFYVWVAFALMSFYWMIKSRKINWILIAALGFWMILYFIQDHAMLYGLLIKSDFESHRQELKMAYGVFSGNGFWFYIKNGDHSGVLYWLGYPILSLILLLVLWKEDKLENQTRNFLLVAVGIAAYCAIISSMGWVDVVGEIFPALNSLNILRFNFLIPFSLFAFLGLGMVRWKFGAVYPLLTLCIVINIFLYQYEWRYWINAHVPIIDQKVPSFESYFAEEQYGEIKMLLGEEWKKVRVGHVNLPPGVSAYNGLNCVDGYLQNYALAHKVKVSKVIHDEIVNDGFLYHHFFSWGNKCYLQNSSYPDDFFAYKWKDYVPIQSLKFDFEFLKTELSTDYILSAILIEGVEELQLIKKVTHPASAWDIYLYYIAV